jgi:hypothetical protein
MEFLTQAEASKRYGALIPPRVKIISNKPKPKSKSKSKSKTPNNSAIPGDELLGVPDKHEFFDPDYENFKALEKELKRKSRGRRRGKKTKKTSKSASSK